MPMLGLTYAAYVALVGGSMIVFDAPQEVSPDADAVGAGRWPHRTPGGRRRRARCDAQHRGR